MRSVVKIFRSFFFLILWFQQTLVIETRKINIKVTLKPIPSKTQNFIWKIVIEGKKKYLFSNIFDCQLLRSHFVLFFNGLTWKQGSVSALWLSGIKKNI